MALIQWSPQLSVGVAEMDRQHQHLVGLINRLHDAMVRGEGAEILGPVLDEVVRYTHTHFAAEERLLAARKYPHLADHKALARSVRSPGPGPQRECARGQDGDVGHRQLVF